MTTDSELIDWLENEQGSALVSDDFGHWAVSNSGFQNVPDNIDIPNDIQTTFFIKAEEWKPSIREAIQAAKEKYDDVES